MKWLWLCWEEDKYEPMPPRVGKSSMVPERLEHVLHHHLSGCPLPTRREEATDLFLDYPGMVMVHRPIESFEFEGLTLKIPSEDVPSYAAEGMTKRTPNGLVTVHSQYRMLVLDDPLYTTLLGMLMERVPGAGGRAEEFYAANLTPQEALAQAGGAVRREDDHRGNFRRAFEN